VRSLVSDIRQDAVVIKRGDETEDLPCRTIVWAAGVQASPLGRALAQATGAKLDRSGRIGVGPDLTIPGHPEIFVIGDLADVKNEAGKSLPGVAPVAMQEGVYVARVIAARMAGQSLPHFHYRDRGNMAIVGHARAVAEIGLFRFNGYLAWLAWLFVHLMKLVEFENRVLVFVQWAWYYFSRNRAARLITGETIPIDNAMQAPQCRRKKA
jgi:NADH dehydrogenase